MCSAPSSYERHFKKEHPLLYKYLKEAPMYKVSIALSKDFSAIVLLTISSCDILYELINRKLD